MWEDIHTKGDQSIDLLRKGIAQAIEPKNLRWYAAFHNEKSHPHAHMLVWSSNPQEPYLSTVGIENIKRAVAKSIFRQDNMAVYKEQTEARDSLKEEFRLRIASLVDDIHRNPVSIQPEMIQKFELLSEAIAKHKGKKVKKIFTQLH